MQHCADQPRTGQVRAGQIGVVEPHAGQVGAGEVREPQVEAGELVVLAAQVLPGEADADAADLQPAGDRQRVGSGGVGRGLVRVDLPGPALGVGPAGCPTEKVGHQRRHLAAREQTGHRLTVVQQPGGFERDQIFHHRRVDEPEPVLVAADQQAACADLVHHLCRVEPVAGQVGQGQPGRLLQPAEVHVPLGTAPQLLGERGHRPADLVDVQSGHGTQRRTPPVHLETQPAGDQILVQVRGADPTSGGPHCAQFVLVQFRDEGQHAGVAGKSEKILDVADQLEAAVGGAGIPAIEPAEELADLAVREVTELDQSAACDQVDLVAEGGAPLGVRGEMLGPAAQHDLGPPGHR